MPSPPFPLHIVFVDTLADDLRRALDIAGRPDRVAEFVDNLSLGPIDPPDPRDRLDWMTKSLGATGLEAQRPGWLARIDAFWQAVEAAPALVVWTARWSALELAGFLEFVWRLDGRPCAVADTSEARSSNGVDDDSGSDPLVLSSSLLSAERIVGAGFLKRSAPLTGDGREQCIAQWRRLRSENAPLRVVTPARRLVSAPTTHYDAALLDAAAPNWRKVARVVGQAMADEPFDLWRQFFLQSRVRALVDGGALEARGNLGRMRFSEVRLPGADVVEA